MKDISISDDHKTLNATLEKLSPDQQMYVRKDRNGKMIYKRNAAEDLKVFNEAHIYIAPDTVLTTGDYTLQLSDIKKIELIRKDKVRSITSHAVGAIAITGASALVILSISILSTIHSL